MVKLEIGLIGLGKMGYNLALNLQKNGHHVIGYDSFEAARKQADASGIKTAKDLKELVTNLKQTKIILIMVPAGEPLETVLSEVNELLEPDDIIIDGGNSHYKDSIRHANESAKKGVHFLDMGTSLARALSQVLELLHP